MNMKNIDYQLKKVDELIETTDKLLNNGEDSSILVFKSPTGSGKTIMTAMYIQEVCKAFDEDICFIWLSIGTGGLQKQSYNKLKKYFDGYPKVSLLTPDYCTANDEIDKHEVVVVNWEAIRTKDRNTGEYKNIVMKDGENRNFLQLLDNTRAIDRKIILVIDESHSGASTERANEIRNEIKASVILEMSATPKFEPHPSEISRGKAGWVEVDVADVIAAQMIKKEILINDTIENMQESTIDRDILECAFQKRLKLKQLYKEEGSNINPLVIIQLPDAEEGTDKKQDVVNYLESKGISIEDGSLAVWLSDEHHNTSNISSNTDSTEFLIFKQAVATGWDCPRAQILVRFREIQSTVFEKQVIGRILRMPEQKHYIDDELNRAFIYSDYIGNALSIIDPELDYPDSNIKPITVSTNSEYSNINLHSEFVYKRKRELDTSFAREIFRTVIEETAIKNGEYTENKTKLESKGFKYDISLLTEDIISAIQIGSDKIVSDNEVQVEGETVSFELDDERTEILFNRILRKNATKLGKKRADMYTVLKDCLYEFFNNYIVNWVTHTDNFAIVSQRLFVLNYDYKGNQFFQKIIDDIIARYKELKGDTLREVIISKNPHYQLPPKVSLNPETHEIVSLDKYFYEECYLQKDRSNPEKAFEYYISQNINVIEFWVKNGDSGSYNFSIKYELNNEMQNFFPDYIVKFSDGRIGIFETKDKNDCSPDTTAKAEKLYEYILTHNANGTSLVGGIVADFRINVTDSPHLKINSNEKYTINQSEWNDLDELFV